MLIYSTEKKDIAADFNILKNKFIIAVRMRLLMIRIILFLLMLSVSITFYSCDTRSGLAVDDFDVVVTFYDNLAPFSTIRRYSMPDSVVVIVDSSKFWICR